MKRREFLKFSSCGLAAIAAGSAGGWALFREDSLAFATSAMIELHLIEVDAEMVDGVTVPMWGVDSPLLGHPGIPGPVLFAVEGEVVRLRVRNDIGQGGAHGLAIPGVFDTGPLSNGQTVEVEFIAPRAGTYIYLDPLSAPVNRVMGLHGVLVVLPSPNGNNTPFSNPTASVQRLFDDLGTTDHFPGHPWDPDRNTVWVFNAIDPDKCRAAAAGAGALSPATFLGGYLPQYFTINGKSGFFAAQHGAHGGGLDHGDGGRSPDLHGQISISGNVGQPCLIRNVNVGLMWHSPHIHGNHVYLLSENGTVQGNVTMVDTWTIPPMSRKDLLLPYIAPPDIPPNFWQRVSRGENDELFPLVYPMHDHNEISNTAAGGNYPQGMATHFQFDGPIDVPGNSVILVRSAELKLRTGLLEVEGTYSGLPGTEMDIHAGAGTPGPANRIGTAVVGPDGSWSWRGRGLKALSSRRITVHNHVTGAERRGVPCRVR